MYTGFINWKSHKEILVDSLTNIKNFVSSWGVTIQDFFSIDKKRFDPEVKGKGKTKDQPKGASLEQFPVLGGKSRGKSGSTNKPKEPTPLTKQGEMEVPSKPKEAVVITKNKPQSPPVKASESTPPVMVKEAAMPKAKSEAVPEVKTEGQPKPPLTLTSWTRKLEFAPPSKPEKPPSQPQAEVTAQEDDEDKDFQAALHESLKAPTSPQSESGAQSSTPKPLVDLEKRETELMAQLDRLMEESVRLESLPNPTVWDRSRIRSVATVLDEDEKEIQEIDAQKQAQSSKGLAKAQEAKAPQVAPDVSSQVSRVNTTPIPVQSVVPPIMQPLTLDNLMAGTMQSARSPPTSAVSPETQLQTMI